MKIVVVFTLGLFLSLLLFQASADVISPSFNIIIVPDTTLGVASGDSMVLHAHVIDRNGVVYSMYDSLIRWELSDTNAGKLRALWGGDNTYYSEGLAYSSNYITVRLVDPANPSFALAYTQSVYIQPAAAYQIWVEADTEIHISDIYSARLRTPSPVDSLVFGDSETVKTLAAVKRDRFGNFVGFDTGVTWKDGDNGVVRVTAPSKPYLCEVDKRHSGTTSVFCLRGDLILRTIRIVVKDPTKTLPLERIAKRALPSVSYERYNILGRKLRGTNSSRFDGIVLERVIDAKGKILATSKMLPLVK